MTPEDARLHEAFEALYQTITVHQTYSQERYALLGRLVVLRREDPPRRDMIQDLLETLSEIEPKAEETRSQVEQARNAYETLLIELYEKEKQSA